MKKINEKIDILKLGIVLVALIILAALIFLVFNRNIVDNNDVRKGRLSDILAKEDIPFYSQYENMDIEKIESYRYDVRVHQLDHSATMTATNYKDMQLRVHTLTIIMPDADGNEVFGDLIYSFDNESLYLENEDGSFEKVDYDFPFTSSSIFLEGINNITSFELIEGDEEIGVYQVMFTKEFFNKMVNYTNASDVETSDDVRGYIELEGDYISSIGFDNEVENIVISVSYYAFKTGSFTEIE